MKKILIYTFLCTLSLLLLAGCKKNNSGTESNDSTSPKNVSGNGTDDDTVIHSILLKGENDTWLFADTTTSSPFTAPIPKDLTDADGNIMTAAQLEPGNQIDIYGNGIMLESYPGQYPGVSKMIVTGKGDVKDIEPYQELLEQFFAPPDLSEPLSLGISYDTRLGHISAIITGPANYTWTAPDDSSTANTVVACGPHILQMENIEEIILDGITDVKLDSEVLPDKLTVTRWPLSVYPTENTDIKGETVNIKTEDNGDITLPDIEPDYIYRIYAQWEMGNAEYAFIAKASE